MLREQRSFCRAGGKLPHTLISVFLRNEHPLDDTTHCKSTLIPSQSLLQSKVLNVCRVYTFHGLPTSTNLGSPNYVYNMSSISRNLILKML